MRENDTRFQIGVFHSRQDADAALKLLRDLGYEDREISVVMNDAGKREPHEGAGSKAAEGITTGGVLGGALGALVAGFTATGTIFTIAATGGLAAPIVVGPLAAALAGLGAGGLAGGVVGGLIGLGIPEQHAYDVERDVSHGGIVVAVRPHEQTRARVAEVLNARPRIVTTEAGEIEPTELTPERTMADIPPRRSV